MRRRRGGGAAPAEACGVWLDTAELKRGPARPLGAKLRAPTRIPERKQSLALLPEPGSRQTTIPTFFSPHTDERDKENSRPTPCTPNKDWKDSGVPLAPCPVKILALPQLEEPPGAEQGVQGSSRAWKAPLDPLELPVASRRQSRASRGAGGDSWCCSFSQGSQHGGIDAHRNESRLFPGETASGSRKPQPWSKAGSGTGSAGAENTNPVPGAAPRAVCCSPQSPGRAQPLRERGQTPGDSCRQLFCQDSQGNRVIAHRDRDRDSCSPSQRLELGSECLFTQDSEGNRVIKHC
ncbi:aurora kinase A and ninein-interacting protein-like [Hirundo rustica]|uniref:aurora kinase A and ninein-interacting protein-like n=1 Tax=Hirundo rustica TaxID=43150 RepID=UPI001A94899A|nr:aurora kinase A and ninein-interacting protein-like [Hirundo rustica]